MRHGCRATLQRSPTHNRLVVGSSPTGPTTSLASLRSNAGPQWTIPARAQSAWAFTGSKRCFSKPHLTLLGPPLHSLCYVRAGPQWTIPALAQSAWAFTGSKRCFSKPHLTLLGPPLHYVRVEPVGLFQPARKALGRSPARSDASRNPTSPYWAHHFIDPSISAKSTGSPCPAPPGAPNQGATCHAVSFRRKRIPNPTSATTPLKKPWHGLLRALVQEWADMNCTINSASNFSGLQAGISQISPAQLAASVRKSTLNRPFISPILSFERQVYGRYLLYATTRVEGPVLCSMQILAWCNVQLSSLPESSRSSRWSS